MNQYEVAVLIAVAVLLVLVVYFITAKGERRKITIINADGSEIALDVELANTSATRAKGLMGRASLGESEGMLFAFDRPAVHSFWMLNTTIPLDAIFIAEDGMVVDIIGMEPCGLNVTGCRLYKSRAQAQYVLEVNQGFSEKHNIGINKSSLVLDSLKPGSQTGTQNPKGN
jgi:uncharacterized membrane protein (UPF0127 family)